MKLLLILLTTVILFSCSSNDHKKSEGPKEQAENFQTTKQEPKPEPEQKTIYKTPLDLLIEDGLQIADSDEQCASRKWATEPSIKLVFDYPQGNKLILEEWEYSFDKNDDDLRLLDFHIFNCQTSKILLEAQYTTASYKVVDVKPSLSIQINADIPTLNDGYSRKPFLIKTFREVDSAIVIETERIFNIPDLTNEQFENIEHTYHLRPDIEADKELELSDFATDELLIDLFRGAINGNEFALELFENIHAKYVLDGAVSELYGDMNYLINEAKK